MIENDVSTPQIIQPYPKLLWFFILSYSMILVLANWFDARLIHIFGLNTDAGTLIFPITFLLSDLITEVYGYKQARRAIWCGFLFNFIFVIYGQLIIHLPSPDFPTRNAAIDSLMTVNIRIIFSSCISYISVEPLNSIMMAKLKIKTAGRYIGIRFILSTIVASAIDSVIFGIAAFYKTMTNSTLVSFILSMWLIKTVIELLFLPLSIRLTKKIKKIERLDIYDKRTDFNIFSLNGFYDEKDNEFKEQEG